MARTIIKLSFSDFAKAENNIIQILLTNNFRQTIINSETVWKKGGTLMGGQCLKIDFLEKHITVSAWITPFLGGEEEYGLEGFSAIVPKKQLLGVIEQIKIAIR